MSLANEPSDSLSGRLRELSDAVCRELGIVPVDGRRVDAALEQAVDVGTLIGNLSEVWRTTPSQVRGFFEAHGLGDWLVRDGAAGMSPGKEPRSTEVGASADEWSEWGGAKIRVRCMNPGLCSGVTPDGPVDRAIRAFVARVPADPFIGLYRTGVLEYHDQFIREQAPRIEKFVRERFGAVGPDFLISSGIGANEQFCHLVSELNNAQPDRRVWWVPVNSVKEMARVPFDADESNTLFMEFSRSGVTEETVKLHEFTPRSAVRVVFANRGPLRSLAERDGNLRLDLPDEVSGRFGRNKTPILLAPMYVAGMDTRAYWSRIERLGNEVPLSDATALPVRLAGYLREQQLRRPANHIYLGTNDPLLRHSADEFCQFWNEGANKGGNDFLVSRYLGLPRDAHTNIEGVLGNHATKMALFVLGTGLEAGLRPHGLVCGSIDTLNPEHGELSAAEQDLILALANVQRCSELMPTVVVAVSGVELETSALLGQLWADVTFVYSRLANVDPGSNPEVKAVRTRAAEWLADKAGALALLG